MKRIIFLYAILLVASIAYAEEVYQHTNIESDESLLSEESYIYQASTSIKLLPGFHYAPIKRNDMTLSIDRYGVFPPSTGYLGGPGISDDGVVGTLSGVLNISDLGAALYSVPIQLPSGINSMTPQLSITYNSQSRNGLLGWGWNISGLSSINRVNKTEYHDDMVKSVDFNDDRFAIDGRRLMLVDGSYGSDGSQYKIEIDDMSKIVAYSKSYKGPEYFIVMKADGTIWEYGNTEDSRIEPQKKNDVVLTWLVNKISDRDGNSILFYYDENQSNGEFYVSKIEYTANEQAGVKPSYQINFVYQNDREDYDFGYISGNMVMQRRLLTNLTITRSGSSQKLYDYAFTYLPPKYYDEKSTDYVYYRLASIGLTVDNVNINNTRINWNAEDKHFPDKFINYDLDENVFDKYSFVGDFNGDGFSDVVFVPYKKDSIYHDNVNAKVYINNGDGSFQDTPVAVLNFDKTLDWIYILDINGDGIDDIVPYFRDYNEESTWLYVYLNNNYSFTYVGKYYNTSGFSAYIGNFHEKDNNSIMVLTNDLLSNLRYISYYDGELHTNEINNNNLHIISGMEGCVSDFNGDGIDELLFMGSNGYQVVKIDYDNNYYLSKCNSGSYFNKDGFLFPGDYNGDGKSDVLYCNGINAWYISFSVGPDFTTPSYCPNLSYLYMEPKDRYKNSLSLVSIPHITIRSADFDGDGICDVGVFRDQGGNKYFEVSSKAFIHDNGRCYFRHVERCYFLINNSHQYVHLGNFFGHENISIIGTISNDPQSGKYARLVSLNPNSSKYSVERITDGMGNALGLSYDYLMPTYSGDPEPFYSYSPMLFDNNVCTRSLPIRALKADTTFNINGKKLITQYKYHNIWFHKKGKGIIGFEKVTKRNCLNNAIVKKIININEITTLFDYIVALPSSEHLYIKDNQQYKDVTWTYDKSICKRNKKVIYPLLLEMKEANYDYNSQGKINKYLITENDYKSDMGGLDSYDKIIQIISRNQGVDDKIVSSPISCIYRTEQNIEYNNNLPLWLINLKKTVKNNKYYGNENAVSTMDEYKYEDGSKPHRVTQNISIPNNGSNYNDHLKTNTIYQYDNLGHLIKKVVTSPSSALSKVSSVDYDASLQYRYPTSITDEMGNVIVSTYDGDYGLLTSTTDYNNFTTVCNEDPIGVTSEKSMPDGKNHIRTLRWANGCQYAPANSMYYCWDKKSGESEVMVFYNKNGLELRTVTFGLNGETIYIDNEYDDRNNVIKKTLPYFAGGEKQYVTYVYDDIGRCIEEKHPNGLKITNKYDGNTLIIKKVANNGNNSIVVKKFNPMGWLVENQDEGGNKLIYNYYSDGLIKSTQINKNGETMISFEYDNRRNKSKMSDPNYGEVLYEYNAFGELIKQVSPKNDETIYQYDVLGRMTERIEKSDDKKESKTTHWIYNESKGKMGTLKEINYCNDQKILYSYDDLLRTICVKEELFGEDYYTYYSYDQASREETVIYPSGVSITNDYSNTGHVREIKNAKDGKSLWKTNETNAMGQILEYVTGNGSSTSLGYNNSSYTLESINTNCKGNILQDLSYKYDDFGNLTNRRKQTGTAISEDFEYDSFNRLIKIKLNGSLTGEMIYDEYGNIESKMVDGSMVFFDAEYNGDKPNAIKEAKTNSMTPLNDNQRVRYSAFDKVSNIINNEDSLSIIYGYDHERRVMNIYNDENITKKIYVGDCEFVTKDGESEVMTFIKGPDGIFAVITIDTSNTETINYIYKDHLGSWSVIADEDGKVLQRTSFDAWGNMRDADKWTGIANTNLLFDRGFTGHEHLLRFGLVNMNGRVYDPIMSMMLSPDSYVQIPEMSQNFNRYSYCLNNPLKYTDPTGEWIEELIAGIVYGAYNVILNAENIDNFGEGLLLFGAGFIQGATGSYLLSLGQNISCGGLFALQVVVGAANEGFKQGVNNYVEQYDGKNANMVDWEMVGNKTLYGLGSGFGSSLLSAYIVLPSETDPGLSIANIICDNKQQEHLLSSTISHAAGNWFSGKKTFDGFGFSYCGVDMSLILPAANDLACYYAKHTGLADDIMNSEGEKIAESIGSENLKSMSSVVNNVEINNGRIYVIGDVFAIINADFIAPIPRHYSDMTWSAAFSYSTLRSLLFK